MTPFSAIMPALLSVLLLTVSCNLYAPFNINLTDEDHIEEGLKCLHQSDYDCATAAYSKISDEETKNQKLCTVNLAKAGFTISFLLGTIAEGGEDVLGKIASSLTPWTEAKGTAASEAKTYCTAYANQTQNADFGTLLQSVALIVHCANLMSKTDLFLGTSEADETCNTPGNNDGRVTAADISAASDGAIAPKGMCGKDVRACRDDIVALGSESLGGSGLSGIQSVFQSIPNELKDSAAGTQVVRAAIRGLFN